VVDHLARGMRYIADNKAYRAFLERDPQKALSIVTSKAGPMQARVIALNEGLLEEEIAQGNLRLPVDAHTMAYALVRIARPEATRPGLADPNPRVRQAALDRRVRLGPITGRVQAIEKRHEFRLVGWAGDDGCERDFGKALCCEAERGGARAPRRAAAQGQERGAPAVEGADIVEGGCLWRR
jgi:hypothetical protein